MIKCSGGCNRTREITWDDNTTLLCCPDCRIRLSSGSKYSTVAVNARRNREYYKALDWVKENVLPNQPFAIRRAAWEAAHPGKNWVDLRTTQEAIDAGEEVFTYNTREAENYVPPIVDNLNPNLPIKTRKGSAPTVVTHQHESDEAILYRLLGGKKEEDWRDFTDPVKHIVREYKPKLSKEIVADALGKLVQGRNSYKRRYGISPSLEFITRMKVDQEVLEDVRTIGAKAFQLTKTDQLVEMA